MKTQFKRFSKSTISVLLAVCLLFSCMTVGLIATSAAQDDSAALGWKNTTWYLGNDVAKVWDNSATNCTMTKSGSVQFYYDFYLKSTDADVYYRPYEKDNYAMGPTAGNNTKVTTTGTAGSGCNDGRCWYFDTADCTANKYNKIRIWIDTSGNNGNGWSWYEKTEISNISPTLSVPSTGTTGTAITLTGGSTDANKIGTLTKTYQYSTDNGSTWTDLSSGSYTATSAGTVKFRYKVSDAGTKTSGSGTNARTARVEYSSEQSCTFSVPTTTYTGITAVAKGTTDGTNYSVDLGTIQSSTTVSSSTGLSVSAPAKDGYTFSKWVASGSGTFDNANNASTKFHPAASSEVATAQYKKVYTITIGSNEAGEGSGTVTRSVASVVAGGEYTITLTPDSYSVVDTLKINDTSVSLTAGSGNVKTYTGTATANVTAVGKFTTDVYLGNKNFDSGNTGTWTEPKMTSNGDGTYSYTFSNVPSDRNGQFKAKVGNDYKDYKSDTTFDDGGTSCTLSSINDVGVNYQLTTTEVVNVTIVYTASSDKITSVIIEPVSGETYDITVGSPADATLTATYRGTTYNEGDTISARAGQQITFSATTAESKYVSGYTLGGTAVTSPYTVTASDNGKTLTCTVANKLKVTCTTNNTSWGTISATPEYARPGDTVTLTTLLSSGTLKKLTVYNASTSEKIKEWTRDASGDMKVTTPQTTQSSANQMTQVEITGIAGSIFSMINKAGEAIGAAETSVALGADAPLTFRMINGAVTVSAEYEEYVGTSEYIYHGVNTSGQPVSGYESKVMSEGSINGQKYAYYNVTGRESVNYDQLFYISKGGSTEGRFVYFTSKGNSYNDWNLPYGTDAHAYFYNSSGAVGDAWPGKAMTWVSENGNDKDWKLEIPAGATGVIFSNGKSGGDFKQTQDIDLTSTNGSYYPSGYSNDKYTVSQWETPGKNSGIISGTDYYYSNTIYKDQWWTGGFDNHNTNNHDYAKPKDGNGQSFSDCKSDYYIVVLYPNTTYTISRPGHENHQQTVGSEPMVLWMAQLPGQQETAASTVKVYAKDGTIRRDGDDPERNDRTYSYFEQHANTFVYSDSGYASHIGTRSSHDGQSSEGSGYNGYTYDYIAKFNKGDTLYIKTNLDSTLKEKYYLAAYCINGKTYELHTPEESATGSVTEAFTVPEDWEDKYVEITPIYFLKDTAGTKMITFYIEGYDEEVMNAGWGNTPFVYPFYQDANFNYVSNINNAFGGYPGQPMVFYKGNYYIQLPDKITTTISTGQTGTATIKGVTLGNGYWDDIHLITGEVSSHFQTYDYDDLYKIYNEKSNADHIICAFKYRTKKNNDEPASMSSATAANYNKTNGNGWEVLTNYYGEPVDVFGNVLTGSAKTLAEDIMAGRKSADTEAVVHAISQDYKSNSAGDYATEWVIYNTSGKKVVASSGGKTSIVPSALAINANTSGSGDLTDNFDKYDNATKAFKSIYTALYNDSNVRGKPAVVTYEKSIYGGGDKADRCDARWYFSQKDAPITATTRIEYTDDGKTWQTDTYTSGTGTGSTTGTKAYFTGTATTATNTPTTATGNTTTTTLAGATGAGYYTLKAKNAGQYEFVGWYLLRDNYQNISLRSSYASDATEFPSHAEMAKNGDIFVARFKKTATGTFDIYHEVHPQTTGYGTVAVSAVVKDSSNATLATITTPASNHVTIPNTYIRSGSGNTVVATFTASPYPTSSFDAFYATVQSLLQDFADYDYIKSISINGTTATVTYDVDKLFTISGGSPVQTVTNVTHYSKFSLSDDLTYSLEYTFKTRYYGNKLYKYTNVAFTEQELRSYFLDQITNPECTQIELDKQFVKAKAPFESNYREDLTWVVDNVTFNNNKTIGYLTATQVSNKWSTATVYDFNDNSEMLTATMVAPYEKLFKQSVTTKPTYASDEEEATAINDWSVTNDQMYHPYRTSYTHDGTTTPLYIDHWDIYQLDSFTYKTVNNNPKMMDDGYNLDVDLSKSVLVAQAYSSRFNYVGYEDYVVVPVYNTVNVDRQGLSDSRKDSSATLLTITRNQWNANAAGNTDESKYKDSADRVYVDFMLNYNFSVEIDGKKTNILLNSTGDNIQVGFIVRSYTWEDNEKHYSKAQYVLVDKAQINDKNRIEYCFGFNNTANNRKAGLYYEFKPFIVDTANQTGSAGCDVTIENTPYKALYADSTVSVLDQVSFYQLGRL